MLLAPPAKGGSGLEGSIAHVEGDAASSDAAEYAVEFGVALEEAQRRLDLQRYAGDLDQTLSEASDTYAGLWIEHIPTWRVIAQFTREPGPDLKRRILESPVGPLTEVRLAARTLVSLLATAASIRGEATTTPFDVAVDVKTNVVQVSYASPADWSAFAGSHDLAFGPEVQVTQVASLIRPTVNIYGGLALSTCTSGFSVTKNGIRGITTAAHCSNILNYQSVNLPFQGGATGSYYDTQWHTAPGFTVINRVWDGLQDGTPNYRLITARISRANQAIGSWVCKFGKTTHYNCGTLINKSVAPSQVPNAQPVFHQLTRNGVDLASAGDSGGPVFVGSGAWGGIYGENCFITCYDLIYTATDYLEAGGGINVTILTN